MVKQKQLCAACGCAIVGTGYQKKGVTYCCESCSSGNANSCECGCCHVVEKPKPQEQHKRHS